jgi:uncharacterized membrane protein YjjP (DUF1212 family)
MTNEKNKLNIFSALILGISILLLTGQGKIETLLSFNLFISLTIFTMLSYISKGELFPITYIFFMTYFSIIFGKYLYKRWKSSL